MKYSQFAFPITPYVELEIGSKVFNCMDYISDVEIEILGDFQYSTSNTQITIFDPDAIEIEKLLLKEDKANLKYGIVDASGKVYYKEFKGQVMNFIPTIKPEGAGIVINLVLENFFKLTEEDKQRSFNDEISNIVKQIASENGLKAEVDKTDVKGIFRQINQTDYEFINNVLLKKAISNSNDSPFFFWIEGDILYFKQIDTNKPKYKFTLPDNGESDSPVLSFSPEQKFYYKGIVGDTIKVKKLNPLTKEYEEQEINNENLSKRPVLGEKRKSVNTQRIRVASHGNSKYEEVARYKNLWGKLSDYPVRATMEILGHPFIFPQEKAEVLVYVINNKTKRPTLYHHSGIFLIIKVKHKISPGKFTTELEMIKNAGLEGEEKAKGIINKQTT